MQEKAKKLAGHERISLAALRMLETADALRKADEKSVNYFLPHAARIGLLPLIRKATFTDKNVLLGVTTIETIVDKQDFLLIPKRRTILKTVEGFISNRFTLAHEEKHVGQQEDLPTVVKELLAQKYALDKIKRVLRMRSEWARHAAADAYLFLKRFQVAVHKLEKAEKLRRLDDKTRQRLCTHIVYHLLPAALLDMEINPVTVLLGLLSVSEYVKKKYPWLYRVAGKPILSEIMESVEEYYMLWSKLHSSYLFGMRRSRY